MLPRHVIAKRSLVALLLARAALGNDFICSSYGMDFQNGGSYFQNSLSSEKFTFVSQFEHCEPDIANNLLVDPDGNEYLCSDTPLTPDNTDQLSTCPLMKSQLVSGFWSILIISNNGDADPIAYERDFSLVVGPQETQTKTPTVTVWTTETPIASSTTFTTETDTTVLVPQTVTVPSKTIQPTVTVRPERTTITKTETIMTITRTRPTVHIEKTTYTKTATCRLPRRQPTQDPTCTITPTLVRAAAMEPTDAAVKVRRSIDRRVPLDRVQRIKERKERLKKRQELEKRGLDEATVTVTETDTAKFVTTTLTSMASTVTVIVTETINVTVTSTPPPVTVYDGKTTNPVVTVTASRRTRTRTRRVIATVWSTRTFSTTVTLTSTTKPPAAVTSCRRRGGRLV